MTIKENDPIKNEARRARRQAQLGADAVCILCGETQWEALTTIRRSLLERHHVVGKVNDAQLLVPICRNCHGVVTEDLRRVGASMDAPRTVMDKIVAVLRALGAMLVRIGESLLEWADELDALKRGLDREYPEWSSMPEAV